MKAILAAIDFSPVSDRVVALAAELARHFRCPLRLLHVAAEEPAFVGYGPGPQPVRDQRARDLRAEHRAIQERAAALRAEGIEAVGLLIQGIAVEKILAEARASGAGLLVLGSHGRSGLSRLLVGSVSEGVLRHAPCPVLVVPAAMAAGGGEGAGSPDASR